MKTGFVRPVPLPDLSKVKTPKFEYKGSEIPHSTFTVRYTNPESGQRSQKTLRDHDMFRNGDVTVRGSFEQALKAAQALATYADEGPGSDDVTSAAVYQASKGVWGISRNAYYEPWDSDMPGIVSLPIDSVNDSDTGNALHQPWSGVAPWVTVQVKDPSLVAVVGRDVWVPGPAAPKV